MDMDKLLEAITPDLFKPASKDEIADRPLEVMPFPNDVAAEGAAEDIVEELETRLIDWLNAHHQDPSLEYYKTMDLSLDGDFVRTFNEALRTQLPKMFRDVQKQQEQILAQRNAG